MLIFSAQELALMTYYPLPWWNDDARGKLRQVLAGEPGVYEIDDDGNPTKFVMDDPDIGPREEFLIDVIRAEWAVAERDDDSVAYLQAMQAREWTAWGGLQELINRGEVSPEEAEEVAWLYILTLGESFGLTYEEPSDDADFLD